jgi:hypothetical protein
LLLLLLNVKQRASGVLLVRRELREPVRPGAHDRVREEEDLETQATIVPVGVGGGEERASCVQVPVGVLGAWGALLAVFQFCEPGSGVNPTR